MEKSQMKTLGASVAKFNILGVSVSTNGFQGNVFQSWKQDCHRYI